MNMAKRIAYAVVNWRYPTVPPSPTQSYIAPPSQNAPGQNRTSGAGGARKGNRQRAHHTSGE
jgi:hypothetical protein